MSETKRKETTLNVRFVDDKGSDEDISKLMELLGVPDFTSKSEWDGYNITAPSGRTIKISRREIVDFIEDVVPGVIVEEATRNEYDFGSYANKDYIEKAYFGGSKDGNIFSRIGYLWGNMIEVKTTGNNVTKSALDKLHRRNVLAIKDKIVSMGHVQSVEYTCTLKNVTEVECSV